jgi:hypothetical protein
MKRGIKEKVTTVYKARRVQSKISLIVSIDE